jgi:hypothetical protein
VVACHGPKPEAEVRCFVRMLFDDVCKIAIPQNGNCNADGSAPMH